MDKSTEDIRFPPPQNPSEDNQSEKTLSFLSRSDREYLERNSLHIFKIEDSQKPTTFRRRPEQPPTRYNQQELAHTDCFYSEIDTMKIRINTLIQDSYDGKLKAAFQDFEKIKGQFLKLLGQFGEDAADLCLKVGAICYRAHVDVEAEEWLNRAMEFSKRFEEEEKPAHFRKLYFCLADVLIKREKWEDADRYLKKGEKIIKDYFEEDESYEGRRSLSWAQALRGHFLSRDGEYKAAKRLYKSQLKLKESLKNERLEALAIDYLADFYITHGKKDKAKPLLERALETSRKFKYEYYTEARHLRNKARIAFEEEEIEGSKELYREAFEILAKELPDGNGLELQYKEEYRKMFGMEFEFKEEDFGEDSWLPTNSV